MRKRRVRCLGGPWDGRLHVVDLDDPAHRTLYVLEGRPVDYVGQVAGFPIVADPTVLPDRIETREAPVGRYVLERRAPERHVTLAGRRGRPWIYTSPPETVLVYMGA